VKSIEHGGRRRQFIALRRTLFVCLVLVTSALAGMTAHPGQEPAPARPRITAVDPRFEQAAVDRGKQILETQCGFCHGSNARGGSGGPDLTRSALVQDDEGGKQLGAFLQTGRPDRGMPPFQLSAGDVSDLATFLHAAIFQNANRRLYQVLDILVGDAKAGEAFFRGAGKCTMCHAADGDLKGVGAKYDPVTLQGRMLMPRGGRGAEPPQPAYMDKNAVRVTVTLPSRQTVSGALVRLTDFDVTLFDPSTGAVRSWLRNGDVPKVDVIDPLQAHVDLWTALTDADMHNMTAYLASLK
jgi:mono/diheme cytochrome c family protein